MYTKWVAEQTNDEWLNLKTDEEMHAWIKAKNERIEECKNEWN